MAHSPLIPPADLGSVSDKTLEQAIAAANRVETAMSDDGRGLDQLDPNAAALFFLVARPAMLELQQYRRRMDVIRDMAMADNVILMPGA